MIESRVEEVEEGDYTMSNLSIGGSERVSSQAGIPTVGEGTRPASSNETKVNDKFEEMFDEGALAIEGDESEQVELADPESFQQISEWRTAGFAAIKCLSWNSKSQRHLRP